MTTHSLMWLQILCNIFLKSLFYPLSLYFPTQKVTIKQITKSTQISYNKTYKAIKIIKR